MNENLTDKVINSQKPLGALAIAACMVLPTATISIPLVRAKKVLGNWKDAFRSIDPLPFVELVPYEIIKCSLTGYFLYKAGESAINYMFK